LKHSKLDVAGWLIFFVFYTEGLLPHVIYLDQDLSSFKIRTRKSEQSYQQILWITLGIKSPRLYFVKWLSVLIIFTPTGSARTKYIYFNVLLN